MGQNLKLSKTNLSQIILKIGFETLQIFFWTFSPKPCNKYELMKSKKLVTSITHKLVGTSFYLWLLPPKLCKNGSTPRFWQLSPKSGWNLGHLRLNFAFHFSSESAKASGVHFAKVKMQERCGGGWKQPTRRCRLNILRWQSFSSNAIFFAQCNISRPNMICTIW